jgi:hypothetical protein
MADLSRESAFLPTIKCSMCHEDIQIALMGEHVCGKSRDRKRPQILQHHCIDLTGLATPPPELHRSYGSSPSKQNSKIGGGYLNPGRSIPPKVDISAASAFPLSDDSSLHADSVIDRPFLSQDQLTPVSLSPSRSISPMTPNDPPRSPFGRPLRSATAPLLSPPSPENRSINADNLSPPLPPTKSISKSRSQLAGGYGGFGTKLVEQDPMYAPVSPRTASSGGLLQRANTIVPGPFGVNGGNKEAAVDRGHLRQRSLKLATMSTRTAATPENMPRPSTSSGASQAAAPDSLGPKSGMPRIPRANGYGGFGPPLPSGDAEPKPLRQDSRSQTFPLESGHESVPRMPLLDPRNRRPSNEPNLRRPGVNERAANPMDIARKPSLVGPDLSRTPPPRRPSLSRPGTAGRPDDIPPVPSDLNLAAEFGIGNPYHTPSESQSSDTSGSSHMSQASSRSSPPRSAAPDRAPWNAAAPPMSKPMNDIQSSIGNLQVKGLTSSPPRHIAQPARNLNPRIPDSLTEPPPRNPARSQTPSTPNETPIRRRTTKKGNCKGCGQPITGKSVSSADGRLTGRYHKECFVCTTCSEPFQTATFYVIDDAPYCEHHYHKLNGSVCIGCDKGIEGQYLETERSQKFHPNCLTCSDCKRILRHDYFEMGGSVYCERDAFHRAQQGRFLGPGPGGNNRMQRRTTRLMMM